MDLIANEASALLGTNPLMPSGYFTYHQVQHSEILRSAQRVHVYAVGMSEQTEIISLYIIS
jgi:hypothetical protein